MGHSVKVVVAEVGAAEATLFRCDGMIRLRSGEYVWRRHN